MARSASVLPGHRPGRRPSSRSRLPFLAAVFAAFYMVAPPLPAEPALPPSLLPWVPWVLDQHPDLACPLVGEARLCAWPGVLSLDLGEKGGRFELRVHADRDLDLPLPGDANFFPREVTVDGRPALLRRLGAAPALALPAGEHLIRGSFGWTRLPEALPLPREIAVVDLRLYGERVARPHREASGLLWLAAREAAGGEEDGLSLEVFRHIEDGVPVLLETWLQLRVAGAAREVDLGEPLPPGFEPYELASDLPARYGRDRRLRVQLRAGEWTLRLAARSQGPLLELAGAARPAPWPAEEIWVFAAAPALRAVRLEGAAGIDPQRTALPEEWKALPAFQIAPGDSLRFEELRRGEPHPPPDEIQVARTLWLAQEGDLIAARDRLTGTLQQGGRLEALPPATLGRAALIAEGGGATDQVITLSPEGGAPGIEVRSGHLQLEADSTYERGGALPAVGWNRDASGLGVELVLPPGWHLLAASGVDATSGAWVDRWTLLDFFLLLILVLAVFRLAGAPAAAVALVTLTLAWHERHAPVLVWLLLALLALRGLALLRPEGAPRRFLRLAATVALLAMLVLFVRWQWRIGRYPQLDVDSTFSLPYPNIGGVATMPQADTGYVQDTDATYPQMSRVPGAPAAEPSEESGREAGAAAQLDKNSYGGSFAYKRTKQADPNAVVQTGKGVPAWSWRTHHLSWQGPVKADQELRLHLISPGAGFLLAVLRIAGWLALLGLLLGWPGRRPKPEAAGAGGGAVLLALLALMSAAPARAQEPEPVAPSVPVSPGAPPPSLLAELEERLTRPPDCAPSCLELARLALHADAAGLRIEAELHAAATTAWALPGPSSSFVPAEVLVDGRPAAALRLQEDGFLALRLARGVHRVTLRGPARDSLSLQFPLPPRVIEFSGQGFRLDGIGADAPPPGLVRIDRILPSGEDSPAAAAELSPWLELGRQFDIGLPWMVHYQLRRLSPPGTAVLLRVPLLPGEAVTSAGVPVENGEALISLEPGESLREWSSTLTERPALQLASPLGRPYFERWELLCSPIWHCASEGLAPVRHMADGEWRPAWRPWPGEQLTLSFVRPAGAPGQTSTLDRVALHLEPGRRLLEGRLAMEVRASRGGEQKVGLPADAELLGFTIDGQPVPAQSLGGQVAYTLEPGSRIVELRWRQDHQAGFFEKMPAVEIPGEAANVSIEVELPQHRWMLLTGGPDWGPVVIFWQDLVAVLIAAFVLGRFAPTPLRTVDWALLLAGLTQIPFAAAAVVVAWLFLLGWPRRPRRPWGHDLLQLLLLFTGLAVLVILYAAIHSGLLMQPDMQVQGAGSQGSTLRWIAERVNGSLPQPWLVWVPIAVYRLVMLLWALWLAVRLLRWLPWCWRQLHREGRLFLLPAAWKEKAARRAAERAARLPGPPPPTGPPPASPPA